MRGLPKEAFFTYIHIYTHTYIHTYIHADTRTLPPAADEGSAQRGRQALELFAVIHELKDSLEVCMHICVCVYIYMSVCVCKYICVCMYVCMDVKHWNCLL